MTNHNKKEIRKILNINKKHENIAQFLLNALTHNPKNLIIIDF